MNKRVSVGLIGLFVVTAVAAQPLERRRPVASEQISGTTLTVGPEGGPSISSVVRVSGPAGYEATVWSQAGGAVTVDLLAAGRFSATDEARSTETQSAQRGGYLPDGRYRYEAVFYASQGKEAVRSGVFFVEGGVATGRQAKRSVLRDLRADLTAGQELAEGEIGAEGETFFDYVAILALNTEGRLNLGSFYPYNSWNLRNIAGDIQFENTSSDLYAFTVTNYGRVGVGTTNPVADLHISRSNGNIRITDSSPCPNPNASWEIEEDFGKLMFEVAGNCSGDAVGGKMWLHGNGRVGIGTNAPLSDLHVRGPLGAITLDDNGTSETWDINEENGLRFLRNGQNPAVATINAVGLGIHTTAPVAALHVAGNGRIDGDVALASSRNLKTAFDQVDSAELLAKVEDLPLSSWRYKREDDDKRHIGPFAEDFQRLFGLGDGETISVIDAQGVMLAAIQGLKQELENRDAEMAERGAQIVDLSERLAVLEARLAAGSQ